MRDSEDCPFSDRAPSDRSDQQSASARRWQLVLLMRSWFVAQPWSRNYGQAWGPSKTVRERLIATRDRSRLLGEDVVLHARRNQSDFGHLVFWRPGGYLERLRATRRISRSRRRQNVSPSPAPGRNVESHL